MQLVGSSLQNVRELISKAAATDVTVLILGETGTGKELVARLIHEESRRRIGPFIGINCGAFAEILLESELFGHERGAFTGAVDTRKGCFELADNGTILLDDITTAPFECQQKLIPFLDPPPLHFRRLGGVREITSDTRLLLTTRTTDLLHKHLLEPIYYRACVFTIELPPLRDHPNDIEELVPYLLAQLNRKNECRVAGVDTEAMNVLKEYHWPGNVQELRNILESTTLRVGEGTIRREDLRWARMHESREAVPSGSEFYPRIRIGTSLHRAEQVMMAAALRYCKNNKLRAASLLGITVKEFDERIRRSPDQETL